MINQSFLLAQIIKIKQRVKIEKKAEKTDIKQNNKIIINNKTQHKI